MTTPDITPPRRPLEDTRRADLAAALDARRDLGREYDDALASSFLDRLDHDLDARIDARIDARRSRGPGGGDGTLPLAIVSLVLGIPLSAIAGGTAGLGGLLLVWVGIVAVNMAHALSQANRRR